jgi:type IX secretion system PorP/SprF family membrane protein
MAGMKYKKIKIKIPVILVLLMLFSFTTSIAQQAEFTYTQYMDNLTPLNPAYSLLDKAGSINTLARKQWVGIDGAPATYLVNGDVPIESINAAAGLILFNDQFAIEHQTEVNAYFAKGIQLGASDYLGVSLNAGVRNYVAYYSQLSDTDPEFRADVRQTKPNIGFGVMFYGDEYYVGLSAPELTITSLGTASIQQSNNFQNHYYITGALLLDLDDDIKFKPSTLISYSKGLPAAADVSGIIYLKEILGVGFDYRTSNQGAGILTINVNGFRIGYSYQFNIASSDLGGFNIPTHEVTFSYRFGNGSADPQLL